MADLTFKRMDAAIRRVLFADDPLYDVVTPVDRAIYLAGMKAAAQVSNWKHGQWIPSEDALSIRAAVKRLNKEMRDAK
jgi:hypothetical protein